MSLIPSPWTKTHYHVQKIVSLKIDFLVVKLAQLGNSIHNSSGIPQLFMSEKHKMLSVKATVNTTRYNTDFTASHTVAFGRQYESHENDCVGGYT